ncbi:MAG: NUDIX domain-containing protein [Patescibacteria group bacterium]|jgi:isopentenyldiphosphate isomerase
MENVFKILSMEYFDILDKDGNPTGRIKPRDDVHRDGDWHASTHLWIINSKQELLIQKRSPEKESHPNLWDISSAGHVPAGTDIITSAVREAEEELGIDVDPKKMEFLFRLPVQAVLNNGTFINNEYNDVFLTTMDVETKDMTLQSEEVSEVKFIPWRELEKIIAAGDLGFVKHAEYVPLFKLLHQRFDRVG